MDRPVIWPDGDLSLLLTADGDVQLVPPDEWMKRRAALPKPVRDERHRTGRQPVEVPMPRCGRRACGELGVIRLPARGQARVGVWRCRACAAKDGIEVTL